MACSYQDTAILLRNWLFDSVNVGQYLFPGGLSSPALTIVGNRAKQSPAHGTEVTGLECVVFYPEPQDNQLMGSVSVVDRWEVQIRQWDCEGTILDAKDSAIACCPYPIVSSIRVPGSGTTGQPEIYRLILEVARHVSQYN
jgi:hypothetical protein